MFLYSLRIWAEPQLKKKKFSRMKEATSARVRFSGVQCRLMTGILFYSCLLFFPLFFLRFPRFKDIILTFQKHCYTDLVNKGHLRFLYFFVVDNSNFWKIKIGSNKTKTITKKNKNEIIKVKLFLMKGIFFQ